MVDIKKKSCKSTCPEDRPYVWMNPIIFRVPMCQKTDTVRCLSLRWLELLSWEEQLFGSFTVPGPLYVLEFCSQPGTVLLFFLQPSAQRSHLLLSLYLYVIGHDHSRLQVSLETSPFLCLVLKHTPIHSNTIKPTRSNWQVRIGFTCLRNLQSISLMSDATTVLHAINFQNVLFISIVYDYLSKVTPDISLHMQCYLIPVQISFYLLFKQYEAKNWRVWTSGQGWRISV